MNGIRIPNCIISQYQNRFGQMLGWSKRNKPKQKKNKIEEKISTTIKTRKTKGEIQQKKGTQNTLDAFDAKIFCVFFFFQFRNNVSINMQSCIYLDWLCFDSVFCTYPSMLSAQVHLKFKSIQCRARQILDWQFFYIRHLLPTHVEHICIYWERNAIFKHNL